MVLNIIKLKKSIFGSYIENNPIFLEFEKNRVLYVLFAHVLYDLYKLRIFIKLEKSFFIHMKKFNE